MFAPDAPIETAKEDRLGRKSFAGALAKAIASFSGDESFVIGVHGKWGTGKSSILNLVVEQIREQNVSRSENNRLHVLRFNPWNFADQNQLIFQFLRQFRAHLNGDKKQLKEQLKELVASLDDYADALAPPLELLPYGSVFSSGLKFGLKSTRKLLGTSKDVNALFDQIAKESKKLKRRTVVLIDDIDRLTAAETRQIFQLVKLTARFPYVIYVLAFDREAVADALAELGVDSGEEYLEKIVQVSFDIPPIAEAVLSSFITTGLDKLLETAKPAHFDQTRFGNLFYSGLRKSFHSLRDVRRFMNGLEFGVNLIGGELNAVDFIGIETVRLFHPGVFYVISANKEIFAGHVDAFLAQAGSSVYAAEVNKLLSSTEEFDENVKSLLLELFPKLAYAYGNTIYGPSSETEWEKSYRIAAKRYFDAYFALVLPDSDVSIKEVTSFVSGSDDQSKLDEILTRWVDSGKLKNAMESVRYRLGEIPQDNLQKLLAALIAIGEKASDRGVVLAGQLPEYWNVRWAIFDVLEAIPSEQRVASLKEVFSASVSVKTMANITSMIEGTKKENSAKYTEFSDRDVGELKDVIVTKIEHLSKNPNLLANEALPMILGIWKDWGGAASEAQVFVDEAIKTDEGLLNFVNVFIYQRHSSAGRIVQTKNRLRMKPLSDWIDLDVLRSRLDALNQGGLNQGKLDILRIARSELQRLKSKGYTPEQFDNDFWD